MVYNKYTVSYQQLVFTALIIIKTIIPSAKGFHFAIAPSRLRIFILFSSTNPRTQAWKFELVLHSGEALAGGT